MNPSRFSFLFRILNRVRYERIVSEVFKSPLFKNVTMPSEVALSSLNEVPSDDLGVVTSDGLAIQRTGGSEVEWSLEHLIRRTNCGNSLRSRLIAVFVPNFSEEQSSCGCIGISSSLEISR